MNDHDLTDLSDLDDNDMALLLNKDQDHHRETDAINNDINEQNKNSAHHAMNSGTSQLGHKNGSILDTTVSASSGANKTLEKGLQEEPDWHISDDSDDDLLDLLTSKQSTGPNANTSSTSNKTVDTNIFNLASSYNRAPQNIDNDVTSIPKDGANTLTGNIFMIDQGSAGQNGHIPKSSTQLNSTSGISTGEHQNATEKTTREFAGANADIVNDDAAANADGDDDDDDGDDDDDDDDDDDILNLASKPKAHNSQPIMSPDSSFPQNNSNSNLHSNNTSFGYEEPQLFDSGGDYGYQEINLIPTQTIIRPFNENNIHTFLYPTNYPVREYQLTIAKEAIFKNVLATIPTGTGKTFIASVVILNYYRWFCSLPDFEQNGKIIFMAPTRPLVAQIIKACLGITGIPYDETAILLDKSRKNRETIWEEKKVFFTTPQVVENDLKRGVLDPKKIVLLVVDEAHRAKGSYAYANVTKFLERFNKSFRVLALTATPSADIEGVQEVVTTLSISKIEVRTESSPDVEKYMKTKDVVQIDVPALNDDIVEIIDILSEAILPVLREANETDLYEETDPSRINAFLALQKANKVIANPSLPEGLKWKYYFILQLLSHVGQMLRRLKIYGIKCFYNYFTDKYKESNAKYSLGKSKNKTAASFYQNTKLLQIFTKCDEMLKDPNFITHYKFKYMVEELVEFFCDSNTNSGSSLNNDSRVIIFTELRESALEIVKCIDSLQNEKIKPHIFIGQARGKENFDETEYLLKNKKKGHKKVERAALEREKSDYQLEKQMKKKHEKETRISSRTGSSEEAQVSGMNQTQQRQVINDFKAGVFNVLVCTSIGEEGLDIGEVDLIICFDATSSPIKNIQRMGRTGRKRDGKIILLLSGPEKGKFNRAMETYQQLQDSIVFGNSIVYQKSDRMLPPEIVGINKGLELVFSEIKINDTNAKVNEMDDPEEVIKFATQAMTGKLNAKKKSAKRSKRIKTAGGTKKQKQFHMPESVTGGIISAIQMLQKRNPLNDRSSTEEQTPVIENPNDDLVDLSVGEAHEQCAAPEGPIAMQEPRAVASSTVGDKLADIMGSFDENSSDDDADIRRIVNNFGQPKASLELPKEQLADTVVFKNDSQSRKNTQDLSLEEYFQKNYKPIETSMVINADLNKPHKPIRVKHTMFMQNVFKIFHK